MVVAISVLLQPAVHDAAVMGIDLEHLKHVIHIFQAIYRVEFVKGGFPV